MARKFFAAPIGCEYVIGSGTNGQSYAIRRDDALFQAPLSYYSKPKKWALSPGFESSDVGFNRPIPDWLRCLSQRPGQPGARKNRLLSGTRVCRACHWL